MVTRGGVGKYERRSVITERLRDASELLRQHPQSAVDKKDVAIHFDRLGTTFRGPRFECLREGYCPAPPTRGKCPPRT